MSWPNTGNLAERLLGQLVLGATLKAGKSAGVNEPGTQSPR